MFFKHLLLRNLNTLLTIILISKTYATKLLNFQTTLTKQITRWLKKRIVTFTLIFIVNQTE